MRDVSLNNSVIQICSLRIKMHRNIPTVLQICTLVYRFYCTIGNRQSIQRSNNSKGMESTASHDLPGDINIKQLFKPGIKEINFEG